MRTIKPVYFKIKHILFIYLKVLKYILLKTLETFNQIHDRIVASYTRNIIFSFIYLKPKKSPY